MSRFKLFGLMATMIASMSRNESSAVKESAQGLTGKQMRMQGDYGNPYFNGGMNQRQRRKLERQVPQRRRKAE